MVKPLGEASWRLLKKLRVELPYDLELPLPGIYPQNTATLFQRDIGISVFIAALSAIARI